MPMTLTRRRAVAGVAGLPLLGFAPPFRPILGQTRAAAAADEPVQAPAVPPEVISADFPFDSHFVDVLDSQIHYVDEGEGKPFLLVHGAPTSSYLWRNVIPWLVPHGRVIAVDLIGMGKSGKPDIAYSFADQSRYLEAFVTALNLRAVTLVLHDWGSALGFDYATHHESNVAGIAFMEALVAPAFPATYDALSPELANFFRAARDPKTGPVLFIDQNAFIEQILPNALVRRLSEAELDAYRAPFLDPASRKPLLAFPNQVPIDGEPADVAAAFARYNDWLVASTLPKLHVYASPGSLNPLAVVDFLSQRLTNHESAYVGRSLHLIQEDFPEAVGRAIADWSRRLERTRDR